MTDATVRKRWSWVVIVAFIAIVARLALGVATWQPGWSALTWDDFTRVAIAQEWAAEPYFVNGLVWLPLPVWITGSVYALAGRWFVASPMALMAILNSSAIMVAAAVSAWSAHRMFRDTVGTLTVFVLTLFAPWGYFLSLSGLAEPLYFVAVAVAVAGLVSWATSDRDGSLAIGAVGVAAAAAMRYEGWWLVAAWALVIGVDSLLLLRSRSFTDMMKTRLRTMIVAVAPFGVPIAWMITNIVLEGSPVYFARESARYFANAYGSFERIRDRVFYYPAALLRAAPFLLAAEALAAVLRRKRRPVLLVVGLFASQFVLFYVASSASGAIGAFPERFLFAYALGLSPLVAGLPDALKRALPRRLLAPVVLVLVLVGVVVTVARLQDRPEEWTHAPDLLALNEQIGSATRAGPIGVVVGLGMDTDAVPMSVQNGNRVRVFIADGLPGTRSDVDVWVERNPTRIIDSGLDAEPAIGRFRLSGPRAVELQEPACDGCDDWIWVDEAGTERAMGGGRYLGFEFVTDDPLPGERTGAVKVFSRAPSPQRGTVDLRWLYGHGFNRGRMIVVVALDGEPVFEADVGDPSRWTEVEFDVPAGEGTSELRIEVVALDGIESGWAWGRASTVLVRGFTVGPA
ncbi:MAG: hypothetical protein ACC654_11725 [Acidimicrobiia bacterium]